MKLHFSRVVFALFLLAVPGIPRASAQTAPQFIWATHGGTSGGADNGRAVVADAAGNSYIVGDFDGTATFGAFQLSSVGGFGFHDVFLVKYNPSGTVVWAKRAGGDDKEFARSIALDASGNILITGYTSSSTCTFGPGVSVTGVGGPMMFVAKYDSNGTALWARRAGGGLNASFQVYSANMSPGGVAVDSTGNVFVVGAFYGVANFGGSTIITNSSGVFDTKRDIFLAKYSAAGDYQWVQQSGSTNNDTGNAIVIDTSDNIYITGSFTGTATFAGTNLTTFNPTLGTDIYLAKYQGDGSLTKVVQFNSLDGSVFAMGNSLARDSSGGIILGSYAYNTVRVSFGSLPLTVTNLNETATDFSPVNMSILTRLSSTLVPLWAKKTGQTTTGFSAFDSGLSVAADSTNNIVVAGRRSGIEASTNPILLVSKYNTAGTLLWTNKANGIGMTSFYGRNVSLDSDNNTYLVGSLTGAATFSATNIVNYGFADPFISKLAPAFIPAAPEFVIQPTNQFYTNGVSFTITGLASGAPVADYQWLSNGIPVSKATNITYTVASPNALTYAAYSLLATNTYGRATSQVAVLSPVLGIIVQPPTTLSTVVNGPLVLTVGAVGSTSLGYQWRSNSVVIPGATNATLILPNIQAGQAGQYTVVVTNASGTVTSSTVQVSVLPVGSKDTSFAPGNLGGVLSMFLQNSNAILYCSSQIGRVNTSGTTDTNYDVGNIYSRWNNGQVTTLCPQADGKVLVGGTFTSYRLDQNNFTNYYGIARVSADGVLDPTFQPGAGISNGVYGINVKSIAVQSDKKIIVAGVFDKVGGVARSGLARLNENGSLDTAFNIGTVVSPSGYAGDFSSIAIQPDGKILVGGNFTKVGNLTTKLVVRFNTDGTLDDTFQAISTAAAASASVIRLQPDGKILVGGGFTSPGGSKNIGRLEANGAWDTTFLGSADDGIVGCIGLQANGKIILGGQFTRYNNTSLGCVVRVSSTGTLETAFQPGLTGVAFAYTLFLHPSGNFYVGGSFGSGVVMVRLLTEPVIPQPNMPAGSFVRQLDGQFRISLNSIFTSTVVLEASTDLLNWTPISTNTVVNGTVTLNDANAGSFNGRYYRTVQQ